MSGGPDGGLYLLIVHLPCDRRLRIGALGAWSLSAGWYLYAGSARRALRSRLARHARKRKPLRWHIDYLTSAPGATVTGAVIVPSSDGATDAPSECGLNRLAGRVTGGLAPVPGFGAGDCHAGCPAHLWYSERPLTAEELAASISPGAIPQPGKPGPPRARRRPEPRAERPRAPGAITPRTPT